MNNHDLWANAYYNPFSSKRLKKNMKQLITFAKSRGIDAFVELEVEKSAEDQHYILTLLLNSILDEIRLEHTLPDNFKVGVLSRDREDFSANMDRATSDGDYVIFIDDLLESIAFSLVIALIYWDIVKDDPNESANCFKYIAFELNEYGAKRTRPATPEWVYLQGIKILTYAEKTLHVLSDVYLIVIGFILAHELGHFVLGHHGSATRTIDNEYSADDFAYKTLLSMIERQSHHILEHGSRPELDMCSEYTYLAPLIFFDIMQMIEHYNETIYGSSTFHDAIKQIVARKTHLESWVYDSPDIYDFDTSDGNAIYSAVLNSIDRFRDELEWFAMNDKSGLLNFNSTPHATAVRNDEVKP
jgi:Peptidase U49.